MAGKLEYAVIQIGDERRGERLNAAIAIFSENHLDVRIPRRLEKLRALSNGIDAEKVRLSLTALADRDKFARASGATSPAQRLSLVAAASPFEFSELASFVATTADAYETWARRLLSIFVDPEPALPSKVTKRTRLSTSFRKVLREYRILARHGEGLGTHRVVPNVQIAEGLLADFVLKNGAMHIIETVDASSDVTSLRKAVADIAVSALVLEQARMTFGEKRTNSRLVYDASPTIERLAGPSLEAAAHQGAALVNWASAEDRRQLIDQLATLADPLPSKREESLVGIHASTQGRLKLN